MAPPIPTSDGATHGGVRCDETPKPEPPHLVPVTAPRAPGPPFCPEVRATDRQDTDYEGNLLHDVLVYRSLRSRVMDGHELHPDDAAALSGLEATLRPAQVALREDGRAIRQFRRWDTNAIPGVILARPDDPKTRPQPVDTIDLGAGGICVITELDLLPGDQVTVRLRDCTGEHEIVMPARVAWSRAHKVGLMFAGGPRWD